MQLHLLWLMLAGVVLHTGITSHHGRQCGRRAVMRLQSGRAVVGSGQKLRLPGRVAFC